jgi:membrane-bound serine protease (ClpP class)
MGFTEIVMQPSIIESTYTACIAYYVLLLMGIWGIFFELFNPGLVLPGLLGLIALTVALYALKILPVYVLIILGVVLGVILIATGKLILRSRRRPVQNGAAQMMGAVGRTLGVIDPRGQALIHGEIWNVYSTHAIRSDSLIKVIAIRGLCLEVEEHITGEA